MYSRQIHNIDKTKDIGAHWRKKERERITIQFCAPSWLINRAWGMQVNKACLGWTFCPRLMNIVSIDSFEFQYAKDDNVKGLQDLFRTN